MVIKEMYTAEQIEHIGQLLPQFTLLYSRMSDRLGRMGSVLLQVCAHRFSSDVWSKDCVCAGWSVLTQRQLRLRTQLYCPAVRLTRSRPEEVCFFFNNFTGEGYNKIECVFCRPGWWDLHVLVPTQTP